MNYFCIGIDLGCAKPKYPGVYADVRNQLDWIKKVTKNCNKKTCQAKRKCMRKQDLVPSIIKRFERITPHRIPAEPVKEYSTDEGGNPNARYLSYDKK